MKYCIFAGFFLCAAALCSTTAESGQQTPVAAAGLQCTTGPVSKVYGRRFWWVYSCDDGKSMVVVSAPGNPALPFYFMFSPTSDGYEIHADGKERDSGAAQAVDAAATELRKLTTRDIKSLIEETKKVKK